MRENPVRLETARPRRHFSLSLALLLAATAALHGCSLRRRPNIPWATAVQVRPEIQSHPADDSDIHEDPVPDLRLETPSISARLIGLRTVPPRPPGSPPTSPGSGAEKSETPSITPQLSPQEASVARQETNQSLSIAEKNLRSTRGKNLSAAQQDLVSKISGFLSDAREAGQAGDWSRARSLAKKAQVLSEELARSP